MIRRRTNQSGFTTVELAFAGLIAAGLTLVGLNLLITSMDMKADLDGRVRANRAARAAMVTITDGSVMPSAGTDGFNIAHGLRNRAGAPAIELADGEVLEMTSNGLTTPGDKNSAVNVICIAANDPAPACTTAGETVVLNGPIAAMPKFQDKSRTVLGKTVEMELRVQDPWAAARGIRRIERYGGMAIYNAAEGEGTPGGGIDTINPAGGN
jgi:hypothetical protein